MQYLAPLKVGRNGCPKSVITLAPKALQIVKEKPFRLCELSGFGFEECGYHRKKKQKFPAR